MIRLLLTIIIVQTLYHNTYAKDFGNRGNTQPIIEQDFLEMIEQRLNQQQKSGELEESKKKFQQKMLKSTQRPPDKALPRAKKTKSHFINPAIRVTEDIVGANGKIIAKSGTYVNPLDKGAMQDMVFIDGDDKEQVEFAVKSGAMIILTKGAPFKLSEELNRFVYFDQGGFLVSRFDIKALPALVIKSGSKIEVRQISEIGNYD